MLEEETVALYERMEVLWPQRATSAKYKHGSYHTNAELIALSSWRHAKKYVNCGTPGHGGHPSYCNCTRYCNACARRKAARTYVRFQHAFTKAPHWYALTYSFSSNVFLRTCTEAQYLARWAKADAFIRKLKDEGYLLGAMAVKELSIASLEGAAVFPHTHVVFCSDRADLVTEEGTHEAFAQEAQEGVSLRLQRIADAPALLNLLKYPLKPINLRSVYEEEIPAYPSSQINLGLDLILGRCTTYEDHVQKLRYYGNMDARCKNYIGENMNQAARSKRAQAKLPQIPTETKELNSCPTSPKMVEVRVSPKTTIIMPFVPQQVMPPQKKKSFWGPLALGVGAGAVGLGAYDHFFNHGNVTNSLVDRIKSVFSSGNAPAAPGANAAVPGARASHGSMNPRDLPWATMPPDRSEPDVIASGAAGYVAGHRSDAARNLWQPWAQLQKDVGRQTAFSGVPGEPGFSGNPSTIATGTNPAEALTTEQGQEAYVNSLLKRNPGGADISDKAAPLALTGLAPVDTATTGVSAAGLGAKGLTLAGISAPGLGRIGAMAEHPVFDKLTRTSGVVGGAIGGHYLGANLATQEYFIDKLRASHPNWTPEQISAAVKSVYTSAGTAAATLGGPVMAAIAPVQLALENGVANNSVEQIRNMAGSTAERGAVGDLVSRLYRGARAGNPEYRNALATVLKYVGENKALSGAIAGQQPTRWQQLSGTGMNGSPALQHLIDRSRQFIQ